MPVVDASVVVDWVAPGSDETGLGRRVLERMVRDDLPLLGPSLLSEEVANALVTGVRRGRWDGSAADAAFEMLRQMPIEHLDQPADLERAWDLSRRYDQHPVYDMLYVALAERAEDVLITADQRLRVKTTGLGMVVTPDEWLARA